MGIKPTIKQVKKILADNYPNRKISTKTCSSLLNDLKWLIYVLNDTDDIYSIIGTFSNELKQVIQKEFHFDAENVLKCKQDLIDIIISNIFAQTMYQTTVYIYSTYLLTQITIRLLGVEIYA